MDRLSGSTSQPIKYGYCWVLSLLFQCTFTALLCASSSHFRFFFPSSQAFDGRGKRRKLCDVITDSRIKRYCLPSQLPLFPFILGEEKAKKKYWKRLTRKNDIFGTREIFEDIAVGDMWVEWEGAWGKSERCKRKAEWTWACSLLMSDVLTSK